MMLIDSDIFIDFFRGVNEAVLLINKYADDIIFSSITEAELLAGKTCNDPEERERLFHVLAQFEKIPVDNPLVQTAGDMRRKYGLALPDAIIAASAVITDSTLITRNIKNFEIIKELKVKKPY
ncbi:MAG: type II toxin-antitoxin system VapC family toxin [Candidatus Woesearchaeota archaeon]